MGRPCASASSAAVSSPLVRRRPVCRRIVLKMPRLAFNACIQCKPMHAGVQLANTTLACPLAPAGAPPNRPAARYKLAAPAGPKGLPKSHKARLD